MLFPTFTFAVFLLVVLPLSWLTMPHPGRWRGFIIVASYVFYGWWDWHYVFLLAGSTLGNHLFAWAIYRQARPRPRKSLLVAAVAANLAVLGYFKYAGFFASSALNTLQALGLGHAGSAISAVLPVGVSFYTFMAISYVVDTYRGEIEPVTLPRFAAYLSFFPHLVAGPIVRPSELLPQMATPRDPRRVEGTRAFLLIAGGLFKKVVLATTLAQLVDPVFGSPGQHSALETWVGIYAYALQIYCDFSGYTDIAIGVALLLGFRFPQNFDAPYSADSLRDFWHRWHMTLSRWLRDYVYIPLGGSRRGRLATYRNLMVTMLLGGLWHGPAWTFVAWGGLHGAGLAWERWRGERRAAARAPVPADSPARRALRRLAVFNFVCLAWVFFRADSFAAAFEVLGRLVRGWGLGSPLITAPVVLALLAGLAFNYVPARPARALVARFSTLRPAWQGVALGVVGMVISGLGPSGVAPFIYFRF